MSQDRTQTLREHKVIPDVLPVETELSYDLKVKFPSATLDAPGKELGREETQPQPKLYLDPQPQEKHTDYVLLCIDPDLMANNDQSFGQVRHWFSTNIAVKEDGELEIYTAPQFDIAPYVGPALLPNYISPRPHRYVFILARPSSGGQISVSAEDFQKLQEPYAAAFKGAQKEGVQDLKDRWGFNTEKFLEMKELKTEAATFMLVGGTLKSAAANMALSGQAIADKVLGR
ncbi:PEBP-like protein [Bimuria novae-zelandiae CBS 107.79]|uniref:PEBP-like protein n=1 Tax=Bimuria novae-zelandiae CBS 107.79 TaxID=1447943 RepID=A0A6A5VPQ3_9PLEO|nr:PEBP-like protein [Bimuria novae-zelandiae CBS 107.79]